MTETADITGRSPRARAGRFTTAMKRAFIEVLCETANVAAAARAAQVGRATVYEHRARDEEFRKAWDLALEEGADMLEAEARRRAVHGTDRPVYHRGECVGHVREYSDALLTTLLKANLPEKYKERSETRLVDDPLGQLLDEIDGTSVAPRALEPETADQGDQQP